MNTPLGVLQVFISQGCRGCELALEVAAKVRKTNPDLGVEVIDIYQEPARLDSQVLAVPAYVYDGRLLFLGNPSPEELETWLKSLQTLQGWLDNLDEETQDVGVHFS
ncbi:MAG: thioredoxin family protein [Dehalococcoidia bacterium]